VSDYPMAQPLLDWVGSNAAAMRVDEMGASTLRR
jgi:hypothetical protein